MRLFNSNFHAIKLVCSKYTHGSFNAKCFSSASISADEIASESKQAGFIESRLSLWNKFKAEYDEKLKTKTNVPIKVTLQYGRVYDGVSCQSTPNRIFKEIHKKAADKAVVAKVNDELWDLNRPLETDCQVEMLTFEDPLAKQVLWHSSAHVLGSALETIYGCLLNTGPPTKNGFYYDVYNNGKIVGSN